MNREADRCLDRDNTDAAVFERLHEDGRRELAAGHPVDAAELLRSGLRLWRGLALADVADRPFARREIERLTALRRDARSDLAAADLAAGCEASSPTLACEILHKQA